MCGLFQPIGQVRLTNVATVRLKIGGSRFEIACYKNKVLNWRSGVETDIQEVLQSPCIFTSITKGKLAKTDELLEVFGTKEIDTICKQILDKGEMQVSKEERKQMLQAMFKDVVTILSEVSINPKTGHPLTSSLIENTLKASAFSVTLKEPAKKQALKALAHLQQLYPNEIARSQMRLKITCANGQRDDVLQFLRENNAYIENIDHSQGKNHADKQDTATDHESTTTPERDMARKARGQKQEAVVNIRFLCCTKLYRAIEDFVSHSLQPPGSLQLVALNVKDAGNRGLAPLEDNESTAVQEVGGYTPKSDTSEIDTSMKQLTLNTAATTVTTPNNQNDKKKVFKCTNCVLEFYAAAEYRAHCKSELHVVNNKLILKGLPPVSPQEFAELELCRKNLSMDD
ncbi:Ribosome maturation protein SBDS [Babesia sp. Xinjiang]|uniref:Ribosome maturation protein SBDS n=1 Tax=Babesia sp. Xinjiang TaxID=462227 RepID=UPI000A24F12C|nr:Ribosome maturation protein SBDS [Babesia sp. Xinjiang]ORM39669.1 Ribosome maturation protein SBDS [Babesia sp. Xinjiang]